LTPAPSLKKLRTAAALFDSTASSRLVGAGADWHAARARINAADTAADKKCIFFIITSSIYEKHSLIFKKRKCPERLKAPQISDRCYNN
jgi:hypothetical protein